MKDDRFGYSSIHFVIRLREEWLAVPSLSNMEDLQAEVQVRTLAQHIWAEASHNLQYKSKDSVPLSISRSINRASALLETVDLEFERVLVERDSYRRQIDSSVTDTILNVDLIEKTLDSLLPQANKGDEDYADLLDELTQFGVTTQQQLRDLVLGHLTEVLQLDQGAFLALQQHNLINKAPPTEQIKRGGFFTHTGLARFALRDEFPELDDYLSQKNKQRE